MQGPAPASLRLSPSQRLAKQLPILKKAYPRAETALVHESPWQLLVATMLSAQCTDKVTNRVAAELFKEFKTPADFAKLSPEQLQPHIRSITFFRNKSKSIVGAAQKVVREFGGNVPDNMEQLLTLPGVARKTANVVLGTAFGVASGVVVDTHVDRLSHRLDLTKEKDPKKIEQNLMKIIPKEKWILFSHQLIWHGRLVCQARRPRCPDCPLEDLCYSKDKTV